VRLEHFNQKRKLKILAINQQVQLEARGKCLHIQTCSRVPIQGNLATTGERIEVEDLSETDGESAEWLELTDKEQHLLLSHGTPGGRTLVRYGIERQVPALEPSPACLAKQGHLLHTGRKPCCNVSAGHHFV